MSQDPEIETRTDTYRPQTDYQQQSVLFGEEKSLFITGVNNINFMSVLPQPFLLRSSLHCLTPEKTQGGIFICDLDVFTSAADSKNAIAPG